MNKPHSKPRARDLGLPFPGRPGAHNAITDIPGVKVGMTTINQPDGPVRSGVTAIVPRGDAPDLMPVWAGFHALNGNGEMTGTHWINDAGYFCGPICITNTHSVGITHHAAVRWMIRRFGHQFTADHLWAMPVVAETYDGVLNDINGQHITEAHALAALDGAQAGPVAEGNVGGGTGMICYEFKGGTGTASRRIEIGKDEQERSGHVGVLVQANHGIRDWLTILGVPVGKHLAGGALFAREQGSIIVIIGTDLPLLPNQLKRVAKRAAIGIGRGGSPGGNNSGDIFMAFSTGNAMTLPQAGPAIWRLEAVNDEMFDAIYLAAVEAIEEAIVNALVAAETMIALRPAGLEVAAIDHSALLDVMRSYNRLA
ncbi:L-aminopeptidase DmpA [Dongia mobilis]|uniref:L-aminopeptidase DmpA n=1 Tax=Dongia mobilis TaxID=578943 RepID=A0A4R6WPP8_9PROT|nr:P1 family peptidase [Dongia mobilis]TDQ83164.1 L-aminopeptidase DmpA [Dongia mobilis]